MNRGHWIVRVSTLDDAAGIERLLEASYPRLMAPAYEQAVLGPALRIITKANAVLLGSGRYYVAESADGAIVGCGGWSRERPGTIAVEPGIAHVRHFGTHPDWANLGIGRAIYQRTESAARAAGVATLECYSSLNAVKFYAALGFENIRPIDIALGSEQLFRAMLMRRRI
jgi:GNAT superfamily N-acetyltransferase